MLNLALTPHLVTEAAPACRCRMIAGAAAGTAVLPLADLLAACGPPPEDPETDTLPILSSGTACTSHTTTLATAIHTEPGTSSGQRDHQTACQ